MRYTTRVIGLTLLALVVCSLSFADEIEIPIAVYMTEFKDCCSDRGLDLYGNRESDGFIQDKAQKFVVYTYRTFNEEQMEITKDCTWKSMRT